MKRVKALGTQTTPNALPGKTAAPVEAVKVAAAEQIVSKPTRRWRTRVFQAYLVMATAAFAVLVVLASLTNYFSFDLTITRAVQTINIAGFASLMAWVSFIGYAPQIFVLISAVAILLFVIGLRWESVVVLIAAAGSGGLGQLIKMVVHRPRPGANLVNVLQQLNSYSFPSGHVLTYTAFFWIPFLSGLFPDQTLIRPHASAGDPGILGRDNWDLSHLRW